MQIEDLYKWAVEYDIEARTIEGFWNLIDSLAEKSPHVIQKRLGDNFKRSLIDIKFHKISLNIGNWPNHDYYFMASYVKVKYDNTHKGFYKMIFGIEGEIEDDYWLLTDD